MIMKASPPFRGCKRTCISFNVKLILAHFVGIGKLDQSSRGNEQDCGADR
jgi:hypothetical protein